MSDQSNVGERSWCENPFSHLAPGATGSLPARARGTAYGLIARGFQYPDDELIGGLIDPARWVSWPEVLSGINTEAHGLQSVGSIAEQLNAVRASLLEPRDSSRAAPKPTDCNPWDPSLELQDTFNKLFGHAVRGKCPPYELEYQRGEIIQRASTLADIAGFYEAFGVTVTESAHDRPDHVAVECEFMSVLCTKEAHAIETADDDHLDICLEAQRGFLRDHLARWLPAFADRVGQESPGGFYGALAGFAAAFIAAECHRFDISVGPPTMELSPADPVQDTTITCATVDASAGSAGEQFVQLGVKRSPDAVG
ncbi:MAG: molecular chaperone TorD family protein [Phycisphaerae bacterium]